jgi:hypothetical protein
LNLNVTPIIIILRKYRFLDSFTNTYSVSLRFFKNNYHLIVSGLNAVPPGL